MGQPAALPNAHLTKPRLHCTLNNRSDFRLRNSEWLCHDCEFYAKRIAAGADARNTAGPETGATEDWQRSTMYPSTEEPKFLRPAFPELAEHRSAGLKTGCSEGLPALREFARPRISGQSRRL